MSKKSQVFGNPKIALWTNQRWERDLPGGHGKCPYIGRQPYRHIVYFEGQGLDIVTNTHETMHYYGGRYGTRSPDNLRFGYDFIYFSKGRGAPLMRTSATKTQVMALVSPFVRQLTTVSDSALSPYNIANTDYTTYLQAQSQDPNAHWEQKLVGHLFREFNCYLKDGTVALELAEANYKGHIESTNYMPLLYFTLAGTKAAADNDAAYFSQNADPKNLTDYHQIEGDFCLYGRGDDSPPSKSKTPAEN